MINSARSELSVVLVGEAGQGIQSIETVLIHLAKKNGYHVFATKEYMSRVRGGVNSTSLRFSNTPVSSLSQSIDILIPLLPDGISYVRDRINDSTLIIGDAEKLGENASLEKKPIIDVSFSKIAIECGSPLYANSVAVGFLSAVLSIPKKESANYISSLYQEKGEAVEKDNARACELGYERAQQGLSSLSSLQSTASSNQNMILSGADAISLGVLAGGCDYVCGYPMSPATGVLERLAGYATRHEIIVEQVEDEVGVINMALGASYAGARAFISTSGGGFALMCEGISLAGMIETPVVVHLAQRPGPATGLPTRTEQGDLNLVRYAGHGDFPRLILAPHTLEAGFTLASKAFDLAEEFQIPVFILTDQYYVDSWYDTPLFTPTTIAQRQIIKTPANYKRYLVTDSGISPRGIPGYGDGIVCADSDEHNEGGYIIEDAKTRIAMADKRERKNIELRKKILEPEIIGSIDAPIVIVSWGSTFPMVRDALQYLKNPSIQLIHFSWLFPLGECAYLKRENITHIVCIENNMTGQFASLLEAELGIRVTDRVLKYDGRPFSVEELSIRIKEISQKEELK